MKLSQLYTKSNFISDCESHFEEYALDRIDNIGWNMRTNLNIRPFVSEFPAWDIAGWGEIKDYRMYWDEDHLGVTANRRYNHYDGNTFLGLTAMEYHVGISGQDGTQTNSNVVYRIDTIAIMEPEDTNTPSWVVTNFSDYVKAPARGTTNWGQPHTIQPPDEDGQIYLDIFRVEFDESKVNGRNISQIDTGKYKDYEKCIAIQWDSEQEFDLKDYLKIEPSHLTYEEIEDFISWKKDGSGMESSVLNYDDYPNEGEIHDYAIDVCGADGTVFDRLIVVVYSEDTKTAFDEWCVEYVDTAWVNVLPPVYSRLGDGNSDPEPGVFNQSWLEPNGLNSFYHHEAAFDMRSLSFDGHGHQATYSTTGILIPSGISAGTADFEWHWDVMGQDHVSEDVLPFVWAAQLDGNPVEYAGLNMTYALIRKSSSLDQSFARRPPHTGNQIPPEE